MNSTIDQASTAQTLSQSNSLWAKADQQVMQEAAIYPIDNPNDALLHASQAHNTIYIPALQNFDFTNVWLDPSKNGG